jgi:hypothetical protein
MTLRSKLPRSAKHKGIFRIFSTVGMSQAERTKVIESSGMPGRAESSPERQSHES